MAFKSAFDTLVLLVKLCNTIRCHGDGGEGEEDDNDFKSTACQDSIKSGQRCGKTTRTTTWPPWDLKTMIWMGMRMIKMMVMLLMMLMMVMSSLIEGAVILEEKQQLGLVPVPCVNLYNVRCVSVPSVNLHTLRCVQV